MTKTEQRTKEEKTSANFEGVALLAEIVARQNPDNPEAQQAARAVLGACEIEKAQTVLRESGQKK